MSNDDFEPKPFGQLGEDEERPAFGSRRGNNREQEKPVIGPDTPYFPWELRPEPEENPEPPPQQETQAPPAFFDPTEPDPEPPPKREHMLKGGVPKTETPPEELPAVEPSDEAAAPNVQSVIRVGVLLRSIATIFITAAVIATLFTWWTPNTFLPRHSMDQLAVAIATQSSPLSVSTINVPTLTAMPAPGNIGIVAGHTGPNPTTGLPDPGAICPDGLAERDINENVALQVAELLRGHGYRIDVLEEFDERLNGYRAQAVVSIHADSCEYINEYATGYKVASFADSENLEEDEKLVECLSTEYALTTDLSFHPSVTVDMTRYHTFREVAPGTPGAIIEIGYMNLDRNLLVNHSDVVALGVARGILCYLRGPSDAAQELTLTPEP